MDYIAIETKAKDAKDAKATKYVRELDPYITKDECLICYVKVTKKSYVSCKLCSNICHYDCYKRLVKKNQFYAMRCCHCQTRSLKFNIKSTCCCFGF
jgi:hypothetical protein